MPHTDESRKAADAAAPHVPTVERYEPYPDSSLAVFRAVCDCGWRSAWRTSLLTAQEQTVIHATTHAATVAA
jgi:hypothetical protein